MGGEQGHGRGDARGRTGRTYQEHPPLHGLHGGPRGAHHPCSLMQALHANLILTQSPNNLALDSRISSVAGDMAATADRRNPPPVVVYYTHHQFTAHNLLLSGR